MVQVIKYADLASLTQDTVEFKDLFWVKEVWGWFIWVRFDNCSGALYLINMYLRNECWLVVFDQHYLLNEQIRRYLIQQLKVNQYRLKRLAASLGQYSLSLQVIVVFADFEALIRIEVAL